MKTNYGSIAALLAIALCGTVLHAQAGTSSEQPAGKDDAPAITTVQPAAATNTVSQVRIVRLSEVKGDVLLDRNIDRGFEAAIANLPIIQGAKLRTAEGVAEVEFEDNSTLRLTPNTIVEFPQLGRQASGATASSVNVVKGIVYVSLVNTKGNEFTVNFAKNKVVLPPSSHIQLFVGSPTSRLGVYEGTAQVESVSGTTTVGKKKALLFDSASQSPPTMVSSLEKNPYDEWDKDAVEYHKRYANYTAYGTSSPQYGLSDLNYYGSFSNISGCGSVWRPYFASAAWDPYANGSLAWYQGAGYSWVSPYPWGWAPYHSGEWQQCSTGAWGWHPGGNWVGLANTVKYPRLHGPSAPVLLAPTAGRATIVPVNIRPLAVSKLSSPGTFVFHGDSAGLGVPRQAFGKLSSVSTEVMHRGSVSTTVYSPANHSAAQPGTSQNAGNSAGSSRAGHNSATATSAPMSPSSGMGHGSPSAGSSPGGSHH